jgi:hypothetical protein
LLLGLRQLNEHPEHLAISRYSSRQLLVCRRAPARFIGGKPGVDAREAIERISGRRPYIDAA